MLNRDFLFFPPRIFRGILGLSGNKKNVFVTDLLIYDQRENAVGATVVVLQNYSIQKLFAQTTQRRK
jgi:hypothetical protein